MSVSFHHFTRKPKRETLMADCDPPSLTLWDYLQ